MSKYAWHRGEKRIITTDDFFKIETHYWRDHDACAECLSCTEDMVPHKTPNPKGKKMEFEYHFSHLHNKARDCPLSSKADDRIKHLWPERWDIERGIRLRQQFCEERNLKEAFNVCVQIAGSVTTDEFISMVRKADKYRIWRYSALPLDFVPYILMTLIELRAANNQTRQQKLDCDFRYNLTSPSSAPIDRLWKNNQKYQLEPVFANSGIRIKKLPVRQITDDWVNERKADIEWISEPTYRKLDAALCKKFH